MSTDLTAAIEHLHEIRDTLDKTLDRLAQIAEGLRDELEPEIPPEPSYDVDGHCNYFVDRYGLAWQNNVNFTGWWQGSDGTRRTWGNLWAERGPLVELVRADQTVVLPSVVPPAGAVVEAKASARQLTAWLAYDETSVKFEIRNTDEHACWQIVLAGADAERWALGVIALVRSKGGAP